MRIWTILPKEKGLHVVILQLPEQAGAEPVPLPIDAVARRRVSGPGLRTFLTTGPMETRAWTYRVGSTAPECAGKIHSDLQRGFIRSETIRWDELVEIGSWAKAKEIGKVRSEGKDYIVQDGDVVDIRFNV